MKVILEHEKIKPYIARSGLSDLLAEADAVPIQLRVYEKGEAVLREGDELDGIYFQVEGRTRVSTSVETGKSLLLRFCHPVSIFGDIELIQRVAVQSRVEAVETSRLLFVDKTSVEQKMMRDCRFLTELLKHLSYKLQTCTSASRINLLASVEERLAIYLVTTHLPNEFGKEMQTPHIPEIASVIGTTPRHLNRLIQRWCASGILLKTRKSFAVLDWGRVRELSGGLRYD